MAEEPSDALVLIVDDEPAVGRALHELLTELGCRPVGPATNLTEAKQAIAEYAFDAALLDIRLCGDDRSFELAEILVALRVPFAFISAYSPALMPPKFRDTPYLTKPFATADLQTLLTGLFRARTAGRSA